MRNRSFPLALAFSMILHGLLALYFIIIPKATPPKSLTSFEMVWEKKESPREPPSLLAHKAAKAKKIARMNAPSPQKEKRRFESSKALSLSSMRGEKRTPPTLITRVAYQPLPTYPWICRKRKQEGVVMIQVKADAHGHAQEVTLHKSSGHDPLDKAALEALKSWVFAEDFHQKILSITFRLKG